MNVDAAFLNGRGRRGVAVGLIAKRIGFRHVENFEIEAILARLPVHANGKHLRTVGFGGGHPNLIAPNDRRRPSLVVNGGFPNDVLFFAPGDRQADGVGVASSCGLDTAASFRR